MLLDFLYFLSSEKSDSLLLLDFLYLLSSYESDLLDGESDDDGYNSGSSDTYSFPDFLRFGDSVGRVSGLGYRVFVPTGVYSKCVIFAFFWFLPIVVESKGG